MLGVNEARHERFFGQVRPNGTPKPHTEVLRRFAATQRTVQPAARRVMLDISPEEFYRSLAQHTARLYHQYLRKSSEHLSQR